MQEVFDMHQTISFKTRLHHDTHKLFEHEKREV